MDRRTKLIAVTVVLVIGIGAAFLFRKNPASPDAEPRTGDAPLAASEPAQPVSPTSALPKSPKNAAIPATKQSVVPQKSPSLLADERPPNIGGSSLLDSGLGPAAAEAVDGDTPPPPAFSAEYGGTKSKATAAPLTDAAGRPREIFVPLDKPIAAQPRKTHRLIDGDTLTALATKHLGRADRYLEIFHANRDVLLSPDLLPIGKTITIPDPDAPPRSVPATADETDDGLVALPTIALRPTAPPGIRGANVGAPGINAGNPAINTGTPALNTYTVQPGDTLSTVAQKALGDPRRALDVYQANRGVIRDPQNLPPGLRLAIP